MANCFLSYWRAINRDLGNASLKHYFKSLTDWFVLGTRSEDFLVPVFIIKKTVFKKKKKIPKEHIFKISSAWATPMGLSVSLGQPGSSGCCFPGRQSRGRLLTHPSRRELGTDMVQRSTRPYWAKATYSGPWQSLRSKSWQWCTSDKARGRVLWVSFLPLRLDLRSSGNDTVHVSVSTPLSFLQVTDPFHFEQIHLLF